MKNTNSDQVKWNKSAQGWATSKCGLYHTIPQRHAYGGLGNIKGSISGYRLEYGQNIGTAKTIGGHFPNQLAAKKAANTHKAQLNNIKLTSA